MFESQCSLLQQDSSPSVSVNVTLWCFPEKVYIVSLLRTDPIQTSHYLCDSSVKSVSSETTAFRNKTVASIRPYMQIATMTTFPGPCRNVLLLPDRGFMKQKTDIKCKVAQCLECLQHAPVHI